MKIPFACLIVLMFVACAPSSNSSSKSSTPLDAQVYWVVSAQEWTPFILSFVRGFDEKFANAFVQPDPVLEVPYSDNIVLNQRTYTDTDSKPYRLTMLVEALEFWNGEGTFTLTNEENPNILTFPRESLAFRLNVELIKALDTKFKRSTN